MHVLAASRACLQIVSLPAQVDMFDEYAKKRFDDPALVSSSHMGLLPAPPFAFLRIASFNPSCCHGIVSTHCAQILLELSLSVPLCAFPSSASTRLPLPPSHLHLLRFSSPSPLPCLPSLASSTSLNSLSPLSSSPPHPWPSPPSQPLNRSLIVLSAGPNDYIRMLQGNSKPAILGMVNKVTDGIVAAIKVRTIPGVINHLSHPSFSCPSFLTRVGPLDRGVHRGAWWEK